MRARIRYKYFLRLREKRRYEEQGHSYIYRLSNAVTATTHLVGDDTRKKVPDEGRGKPPPLSIGMSGLIFPPI